MGNTNNNNTRTPYTLPNVPDHTNRMGDVEVIDV